MRHGTTAKTFFRIRARTSRLNWNSRFKSGARRKVTFPTAGVPAGRQTSCLVAKGTSSHLWAVKRANSTSSTRPFFSLDRAHRKLKSLFLCSTCAPVHGNRRVFSAPFSRGWSRFHAPNMHRNYRRTHRFAMQPAKLTSLSKFVVKKSQNSRSEV